jgi:hypothetical protein
MMGWMVPIKIGLDRGQASVIAETCTGFVAPLKFAPFASGVECVSENRPGARSSPPDARY